MTTDKSSRPEEQGDRVSPPARRQAFRVILLLPLVLALTPGCSKPAGDYCTQLATAGLVAQCAEKPLTELNADVRDSLVKTSTFVPIGYEKDGLIGDLMVYKTDKDFKAANIWPEPWGDLHADNATLRVRVAVHHALGTDRVAAFRNDVAYKQRLADAISALK